LLGFLHRDRHARVGRALYAAAVTAARAPLFYTEIGVADTLDGRFDLIGLHGFLLIRRLGREPEGAALAQAVFDAMFADMDASLREMGVGDLSLPARVRAMWEAFHGRAAAYERAFADPDPAALAAALTRNVWRGAAPEGAAARLARIARAQDAHLAAQPLAAFAAGTATFLEPAEPPA
jgi:cytochrome b pre-mRNA-processing protein 3